MNRTGGESYDQGRTQSVYKRINVQPHLQHGAHSTKGILQEGIVG